MLYPTAFNGRVFRCSAFYCNIFNIDNQLNELLCDAEVPNELCNLPAPKAKLPYTECIRAFNRFDPNTMTCSNMNVKQYIGISDILLKFQTRATISRCDRWTGLEGRWEGRNVVLSGFIALWVRVLSIIDLVAKVEAIHLPRILSPRSSRKSELLPDKIGRFNFKMEERCRRKYKSVERSFHFHSFWFRRMCTQTIIFNKNLRSYRIRYSNIFTLLMIILLG